MTTGSTLYLNTNVTPDNAYNKDVIWKSSDTAVATVSEDGTVNAVSYGTVVITATSVDNAYISSQCNFTVKNKSASPFKDVSVSSWYYRSVERAFCNNIASGTSQTLFSPNVLTTRGMFVTLLANMVGVDKTQYASSNRFSDVPTGKYFAPCAEWAFASGIVSGTSATTFSPDTPITREQILVMLYNFASKVDGIDTTGVPDNLTNSFKDTANISRWAKTACDWATYTNQVSVAQPTTTSIQKTMQREVRLSQCSTTM